MWTKSFGNWLKSGSEPRPLWRRDPGLNLFAGICKKPLIQSGKSTPWRISVSAWWGTLRLNSVRVNGRVPGLIKSFNPKGDFLTCERPDQFLTPKRGFMSSKGQRIGYVRVSSYDQNPGRQLEHLDVDRVFTDKASGKDAERPQLKALLSYARDGDTIVVHSMDRLARNVDDLRRIVLSETRRGVRMKTLPSQVMNRRWQI